MGLCSRTFERSYALFEELGIANEGHFVIYPLDMPVRCPKEQKAFENMPYSVTPELFPGSEMVRIFIDGKHENGSLLVGNSAKEYIARLLDVIKMASITI